MNVYVVMLNRGDGEGDRLEGIFNSVEAAEAFIEAQDYKSWYDWYSWKVNTLADITDKNE
jgi:hypothetical protein